MVNNQINGYLASVGGVVGSLSGSAKISERARITQDGAIRITQDGSQRLAITIEAELLSIEGRLQEESRLCGQLQETVTLHGTLQSTADLSANLTVPPIRGGIPYGGRYEVTPMIATEQVLETAHRVLSRNVTVKKIPIFITTNPQGGETVYIGGDIDYG